MDCMQRYSIKSYTNTKEFRSVEKRKLVLKSYCVFQSKNMTLSIFRVPNHPKGRDTFLIKC